MTHDKSIFIDLNAQGITTIIVRRIYYDQNTMRHVHILIIIPSLNGGHWYTYDK